RGRVSNLILARAARQALAERGALTDVHRERADNRALRGTARGVLDRARDDAAPGRAVVDAGVCLARRVAVKDVPPRPEEERDSVGESAALGRGGFRGGRV